MLRIIRMVSKFYGRFAALLVICTGIFTVLEYLLKSDSQGAARGSPTSRSSAEKRKPKEILLWTHYYKSYYYGFGAGDVGFHTYDCPVKDCVLTDDRTRLAVADAVVYHAAEIKPDKPPPTRGHADQIYVFLVYESPWSVHTHRLNNLTGVFNLTVTYMDNDETDIPTPYGAVVPRDKPAPSAIPSVQEIQAKTKMVAWLVSNCHPISSRRDYANELAKYVNVDIYGNCGNLSCPKGNASCYNTLVRDHLFMLSFENSYCTDYVTEKLFRAMRSKIVPIVLGRARYDRVLPPKSFLDVRDFASPRDLADFLTYLDGNRTAYREYFAWKEHYQAAERSDTRPRAFCRLCEVLHDESYRYRSAFDPTVYWSRDRHCLTGDEERRDVHLYPEE